MADFTQEELFIIGKALEGYQQKASGKYRVGEDHSVATPEEIIALRRKLTTIYAENLGEGHINHLAFDKPEVATVSLDIGQFYRVVHEGHTLDGKRVKLESVKSDTDMGRIRAWVVDGIMNVVEVPGGSLVPCE